MITHPETTQYLHECQRIPITKKLYIIYLNKLTHISMVSDIFPVTRESPAKPLKAKFKKVATLYQEECEGESHIYISRLLFSNKLID